MDGYVVYPNCLAFALAVCARQRTSEKLRHAAYSALATVCKTPKDLFEFVNFAGKLTRGTKGMYFMAVICRLSMFSLKDSGKLTG